MDSGEDLSWLEEYRGSGETHISSKGTLPRLSTRPGVDSLRGRAAKKVKKNPIHFRPPNHYFRALKTQKFFDDIRFLD